MQQIDKRQQRRRSKTGSYAKMVVGGVVFVPAMAGVPAVLLLAPIALASGAAAGWSTLALVIVFVLCLGGAALMGQLGRWTQRAASEGYRELVGELVRDNIDHIPTARVLVRGAQQPAAPTETLLRPAGEGGETNAEELLRSHE